VSIIRFDHVSKQFTLNRQRSRSFQELFLNAIHFKGRSPKETYWALDDVSFEVNKGEMVGIVGPNGAGKSTILKLIAHIIEPTSGKVEINGTVGALLELGAGFHPDLSGRENIYLNGSILGFSRQQMDRIYHEIVDFSEMGRFIDMPVKHYSSGMFMRLGFSIAIHLEPDMLLVDEVLAVGDKGFQLRCLDKINQMRRAGVSILLVTHNLDQVQEMCDRAIWLSEGRIQASGSVEQVLEEYMIKVYAQAERSLLAAESAEPKLELPVTGVSADETATLPISQNATRWGSGIGQIVRVQMLDGEGNERRVFTTGESLIVRMNFKAQRRIEKPQFGIALHHANGFHINGPNTVFAGLDIEAIEGQGYIDYRIQSLPLLEGTYLLSTTLYNQEGSQAYDHHHQVYTFRVRPNKAIREEYGSILIPSSWEPGPTGVFLAGETQDAGF
jgi:lipopolysaccharide transport system ATP-binding protein